MHFGTFPRALFARNRVLIYTLQVHAKLFGSILIQHRDQPDGLLPRSGQRPDNQRRRNHHAVFSQSRIKFSGSNNSQRTTPYDEQQRPHVGPQVIQAWPALEFFRDLSLLHLTYSWNCIFLQPFPPRRRQFVRTCWSGGRVQPCGAVL